MSHGSKLRKKRRYRYETAPIVRQPDVDPESARARTILSSVGVDRHERYLELRREAGRLSWDELIDQLVMQHAPDALLRAVCEYFDASDLPLYASKGRRGIRLCGQDLRPRAVIQATRARLAIGATIPGDFTADGRHWNWLRHLLLVEHSRELGSAPRPVAAVVPSTMPEVQVLTEFPPAAAPSFRAEALSASARIRTERSLAFDRAVTVEALDYAVRFEPISNRRGPVELPFEYLPTGRTAIRAALRLRTPGDPLALVCPAEMPPSDLADAWGVALLAFAELTCGAELVASRSEPAEPRASTPSGRRGGRRGRIAARRGEGRRVHRRHLSYSSTALEPSVATARFLDSYVAGHRRRLVEGARASDSAKRAAAEVGVDLRPQETWVRPHARGVPEDAELRFRWTENPRLAAAA